MVHFSGKARKMNHIPLSRERSERENQQFSFYVWFQKELKHKINIYKRIQFKINCGD
ncbi:MAG: hypothetical protein U5L45_20660 [Saprospiraceae bacterium]|nr:hypothetical protein [Saprospiraceae bacterium]